MPLANIELASDNTVNPYMITLKKFDIKENGSKLKSDHSPVDCSGLLSSIKLDLESRQS